MSNQRIAINTAATYSRTVFAAALALFSSRWVLMALGPTDFGLFSVVGSIIIFVTFLNSVMAGSASRYFAYSIGQGDSADVNRWFNSALGIHLCLAFLLLVIGWLVGEYLVAYVLVIPHDRVATCINVFRISLVSAFVSMLAVPFVSMFFAKQHIAELAVWGILQAILSFALAWALRHVFSDRLLFYAIGMVAILIFVQAAQIVRALIVFKECSISCRQLFDRRRFKEIFSFASWNLIGCSGVLFRDQGSAIVLNLFFGPSVNAAYGIATQVSSQTNQLSAAMLGAFSPEITACEGRGDRARMLSLSQRACKFGTILVLLFAIPLITEMDYVLKLWLHVPPPYTALFCQLILVTFLIDRLSTGYMLAVNAHGKIAAYQATLGTSQLLTLPLAWLFLKNGLAPTSIGIAFIITMTITSLGRVLWGRHLLGMPVRSWFTTVVCPSLAVALVSTVSALAPHWLLPTSLLRLILVTAASITVTLLTTWFFALDLNEHEFVGQSACRFLRKFGILSNDSANL
jgi:O-antigen/teichoic acid export membrane protein